MWQIQWVLALIPDSFFLWITYLLIAVGVGLYVASKLVTWIPLISQYKLPAELVAKLTGKLNDDDQLTGGLLTPGQAAAVQKNGLSIIMDRKAFNSDMYNSMFTDPLAAYVDRDNSYTWTDPVDSRYNINITQSAIGGEGSYQMDYNFPVFDQETNQWKEVGFTTIADNANKNYTIFYILSTV